MHICIYVYVCICVCVYIYIYMSNGYPRAGLRLVELDGVDVLVLVLEGLDAPPLI